MALSLCQKLCPEKLSFKLGKRLGEGSDGEVFNIINDPNKVIKLCMFYPLDNNVNECYSQTIIPILTSLVSHPVDVFARVYMYEHLGIFSDQYSQEFVLYFYTMEKLEDIFDDEKKVFHTILSHEDRGIVKNFSLKEVQEILQDLSLGLDFDENKVIFFYKNLKLSNINHTDIHPRNIMKDKMGNFKMVDFDRAQLKLNGE